MFGGNNAWGNTQQNQQQQQQPQQGGGLFGQTANAFGQPAAPPAFGATGTTGFGAQPQQQSGGLFGSTQPAPASTGFGFGASTTTNNAFGQPQRPGFGSTGTSLFGANAGSTTTPAFGGFGANQQQQPTGNIGLGGMNNPAPATGGLFGGGSTGSTFGSTGFGAKPATTGFGATPSTGGLFGQKPAVSSPFGQPAQQQKPGEMPQWQPYKEKDNPNNSNSVTNVFHTITAHPQYRETLLEEIRLKDYMEGRKTAPANTGATGGMSIFGQANQTQQTNAFGQPAQQSTGFGAPAQQSGGLFGQSTNTFGQTSGGFGQPAQPATTGFGATPASNPFGQQNQQQGTSLFGQPANNAASNPFGASTSTPAFGQPAQPATTFGFGQNNDANKPATGFGFGSTTQPATGGLFGQQNNTTAALATSGFSFGQPQQNQAQPASGGFSFGANQSSTQPAGTSLFGANNNQQQSTGGLFGQPANNAAKPSLFGQPAQTGTTGGLFGGGGAFGANNTNQQQQGTAAANPFGASTSGTSLFGQPQQNQQQSQQQQPSTSLFGGGFGATQNKPATGGLFGAPAATQQPAAGGFSFGNTGQQQQQQQQPSTGLFGSTTTQQNQASTTGFGAGTAGNSLFGAPKPAGSLFGGGLGQSTNNPSGNSGGLFGQQNNQATGTGGFGFGQQSGGLLNSQNQPGQLQQSQQGRPLAAISSDPYGSSGFFSIPSIPQGSNQTVSDLFALPQPVPKSLPPLSSSSRGTPSVMRSSTKLRGFANPQASSSPRATLSSSALGLKVNPVNSSIFDSPSATHLDANAFTPRSSVKKLVIDKKSTPRDRLLNGSRSRTNADRSHLILDNGDNDSNVAESVTIGSEQGGDSGSPMPKRANRSPSRDAQSANKLKLSRKIDLGEIPEDEYYTIPDMSVLANAGHEELSEVRDFVVGRKGWGELRYKKPVNLNEVPELRDIPGVLVQFEERMQCEVYPDEAGDAKRPAGQGLNQPARITIEQCWPKDPSTGEHIKDPEHPKMKIRRRKIQSLPDTTFVTFDPVEGRAVFDVEHFTKYGVDSDEDEEELEESETDDMDSEPAAGREASRSRSGSVDDLPPQRTLQGMSAVDGTTEASESMSSGDDEDQPPRVEPSIRRRGISEIPPDTFNRSAVELMRQSLFDAPALQTISGKWSAEMPVSKPEAPHFGSAGRGTGGPQGGDIQVRASFGVSRKATGGSAPPYKLVRISAQQSMTAGRNNLVADAGLSRSQSFRAGWDRNSHIARLDDAQESREDGFAPSFDRIALASPPNMTEFDIASARQLLDALRHQCTFTSSEGCPSVSLTGRLSFRTHADIQQSPANAQLLRVLRLGRALFDRDAAGTIRESDDDAPESMLRKAALSSWLKAEVKTSVERDVVAAPMGPARVFAHLTGHDLEGAVAVASEAGDLRLATLVAQANGSADFKQRILDQLEIWQAAQQSSHIDSAYRRLYALLAGIVDVLPASSDRDPINSAAQVEVDRGLDWIRAFGLHLWYGTSLDASIEDALQSYRGAIKEHKSTPRPLLAGAQETDAVYSMLELFCEPNQPLDDLLRPAGLGVSALDVSGQWHLHRVLAGARKTRDRLANETSSTTADKLTIDYAAQLEAVGMWKDALFVLLHLSDATGRVAAVKRLIGSRGDQFGDAICKTLVEEYKIPVVWLEAAKADLARDRGRVHEEYQHSMAAGLFDRAHDLAINELLPEAIIRSDQALIRKLVNPLQDKPVELWSSGGKVLLSYVKLCDNAPGKSTKETASADLGELAATARSVKAGLASLFRRNFEGELELDHAAAIETMFATVTRVEGLLRRMGSIETSSAVPESISESERLRLVESATRDNFMVKLQACW